jgi:hypothetical protein
MNKGNYYIASSATSFATKYCPPESSGKIPRCYKGQKTFKNLWILMLIYFNLASSMGEKNR